MIPRSVNLVKEGKSPVIYGDGEQTRDFTYVTDIVSALIAAAESTKTNKIYNVGSDTTISINKIVELLGGDKVNIPKRPGEPDCTYADITKARNELDYQPQVNIETGIKEFVKWYREMNQA